MGRLTLNVLLSFAQFERDMISERTRDRCELHDVRDVGSEAKPIHCYNVVDTKLVVEPLESLRVQEIFRLYLKMKSTLQVARVHNERDMQMKEWDYEEGKDDRWWRIQQEQVTAILTNATYIGMIEYEGQLLPGLQEAIIRRDVFDQVQEILKQNSRRRMV